MDRIFLFCAIIFLSCPIYSQDFEWLNIEEGRVSVRDLVFHDDSVFVLGAFNQTLSIQGQEYMANGGSSTTAPTDIFLAKFDKQGILDTVFTFGGSAVDITAHDLAFDPDGNMVFGGVFSGTVTFGDTTLVNTAEDRGDRFIVKYTRNGELIWVENLRITDFYADVITSIEIDDVGNIFTASFGRLGSYYINMVTNNGKREWQNFTTSSPILIPLNGGEVGVYNPSGFYRHLDSNGNTISTSSLPFQVDLARKVSDNEILFLSEQSTNSVLPELLGTEGGHFVFSTDMSGQVNWGSRITDNDESFLYFYDIEPINDGEAIISGGFYETFDAGDFEVVYDTTNVFLALASPDGAVEWTTSIFDKTSSIGGGVNLATDNLGHTYLSGAWLWDSGYFNCNESLGTSTYRFALAKMDVLPDTEITSTTEACSGETIVFEGFNDVNIANYRWVADGVLDSNNLVTSATTGSILLSDPGVGSIKLYGEYHSSCGEFLHITTQNITVNPLIEDGLVVSGPPQLCHNEDLSFSISSGVAESYNWSFPPELDLVSQSGGSLVVRSNNSPLESGEVSVTLTNGCDSKTFRRSISFTEELGTTTQPTSESLPCRDFTISVSTEPVNAASSYEWNVYYADLDRTETYTTEIPQLDFDPIMDNLFQENVSISVRALNPCGVSAFSAPLLMQLFNLPDQGQIVYNQLVCTETPINFSVTSFYDSYIWVLRAQEGSLIDSAASLSDSYVAEINTPSTLQVYGTNNCGTMLLDLEEIEPLIEEAPQIIEDCDRLLSSSTAESSTWVFDGEVISNSNEVFKQGPGTYLLQVQTDCREEQYDYVVEDKYQDVFIPNAITPNGDGLNDSFQVSEELVGASITIFNRAGTTVFVSTSYENEWEPTNTEPGVYYYSIQADCRSFKGYIHVIK